MITESERVRLDAAAAFFDCKQFGLDEGEEVEDGCNSCGRLGCWVCQKDHSLLEASLCRACIVECAADGTLGDWVDDEGAGKVETILVRHEAYIATLARLAEDPSLGEL